MFGKRRWAVRVIDHMGLKAGEPVGGELVSLLVSLSKQLGVHNNSRGPRLDDGDLVLQAALMAATDPRTVGRLTNDTGVSSEAAAEYAGLLFQAAEVLAVKSGRERVLSHARG
jgi:hypothetical protein